MNKFVPVLIILLFLIVRADVCAQFQSRECRDCPLPGGKRVRDTTMLVYLKDGTVLQNCCSASRALLKVFDGHDQAIRLVFCHENGSCSDTIVAVNKIDYFRRGGIGGSEAPLRIVVFPVREYYQTLYASVPVSLLELSVFGGIGGKDESFRNVGFKNTYFGIEGMIAPFGTFMGENLTVALGGEFLSEGGRSRFPLIGHLRWTFLGNRRIVDSSKYIPDNCKFEYNTTNVIQGPNGKNVHERPSPDRIDSSSYLLREKTLFSAPWRPFVFAEGGVILNSSSMNVEDDNVVNPEDRGQYLIGVGVGLPLFDFMVVSLGYRYMRLNLDTPCVACQNKSVVNTNVVHSLLLKTGIFLEW